MTDFPDWMLHYSAVRTLEIEGKDAVDDHMKRVVSGEETDHATAWDAARAAIFERMADFEVNPDR